MGIYGIAKNNARDSCWQGVLLVLRRAIRLPSTMFLCLILLGCSFCRANNYYDPATGVLMLEDVRVGKMKYANVRVKVQQIGTVSNPSHFISLTSFDPTNRTLDLPSVIVGFDRISNVRVELKDYSVLDVGNDETPVAARKLAEFIQGTYTLNCNYVDTTKNKFATGTEIISIDSEGNISGNGLESFISRPTDADYVLRLSTEVFGFSVYNQNAIIYFRQDGNVDTTPLRIITGCMHCGEDTPTMTLYFPGVSNCWGISGKTPKTFSAITESLASSGQLYCHSDTSEIDSGLQTVSVGADRSLMLGNYYLSPAEQYIISASSAGIVLSPYANPWMILPSNLIIDAITGQISSVSYARRYNLNFSHTNLCFRQN